MSGEGLLTRWSRILRRGAFPHEFAWLIDNPVRRLFITPERLIGRLAIKPDMSVLEIGPGSGFFSRHLAAAVPHGRLTLVDLQPEMLAMAREKLEPIGSSNVHYAAANASGALPFAGEAFDLAVLVTVLGEVPEPGACLGSIKDLLRPLGRVAIHEHLPDPDFVPLPSLKRLCGNVGLEFRRYEGLWWNYTAVFQKPAKMAVR